jgi:hypothetical protein
MYQNFDDFYHREIFYQKIREILQGKFTLEVAIYSQIAGIQPKVEVGGDHICGKLLCERYHYRYYLGFYQARVL